MRKLIMAADRTPIRVVIVTLDSHLAGAVDRAKAALAYELPGLELSLHAAAEWDDDPKALERARRDVETGDIILASMLFIDDQIKAILPALAARRERVQSFRSAVRSRSCFSSSDAPNRPLPLSSSRSSWRRQALPKAAHALRDAEAPFATGRRPARVLILILIQRESCSCFQKGSTSRSVIPRLESAVAGSGTRPADGSLAAQQVYPAFAVPGSAL